MTYFISYIGKTHTGEASYGNYSIDVDKINGLECISKIEDIIIENKGLATAIVTNFRQFDK